MKTSYFMGRNVSFDSWLDSSKRRWLDNTFIIDQYFTSSQNASVIWQVSNLEWRYSVRRIDHVTDTVRIACCSHLKFHEVFYHEYVYWRKYLVSRAVLKRSIPCLSVKNDHAPGTCIERSKSGIRITEVFVSFFIDRLILGCSAIRFRICWFEAFSIASLNLPMDIRCRVITLWKRHHFDLVHYTDSGDLIWLKKSAPTAINLIISMTVWRICVSARVNNCSDTSSKRQVSPVYSYHSMGIFSNYQQISEMIDTSSRRNSTIKLRFPSTGNRHYVCFCKVRRSSVMTVSTYDSKRRSSERVISWRFWILF